MRAISAAGRAWMPCGRRARRSADAGCRRRPSDDVALRCSSRVARRAPSSELACRDRPADPPADELETLAVRHDDRRQQARCPARDDVEVEPSSGSPGRTRWPAATSASKPSPLSATVSMPTCSSSSAPLSARSVTAWRGRRNRDHFAVAGRAQQPRSRVDRHAVAEHAARRRPGRAPRRAASPSRRAAPAARGVVIGALSRPASSSESIAHSGSMPRPVNVRQRSCVPARGAIVAGGSRVTAVVGDGGRERQRRDPLAVAAVDAHLELAVGRRGRAQPISLDVLADLEVEGKLPDRRAISVDAVRGRRPRQIQHGFMMSIRNTARDRRAPARRPRA